MIFKDGDKVDMVVGAVPKTTLATTLEKYLWSPIDNKLSLSYSFTEKLGLKPRRSTTAFN
jgi:hypothetical protein